MWLGLVKNLVLCPFLGVLRSIIFIRDHGFFSFVHIFNLIGRQENYIPLSPTENDANTVLSLAGSLPFLKVKGCVVVVLQVRWVVVVVVRAYSRFPRLRIILVFHFCSSLF